MALSLIKSIFLGLVATYSLQYNRRRMEHVTYALWTSVLAFLSENQCDVYITCPQYGLYVLPNERARYASTVEVPAGPDSDPVDYGETSMRTEAGSGAEGVFLDLCLLMPYLELRQKAQSSTLAQLLNKLSFTRLFQTYTAVWIQHMDVPLIIELKKPPSRSPSNISSYVHQIEEILLVARYQVSLQGHCLFSSRRYKSQDEVILIAGSGEWWCCTIAARDDYKEDGIFTWESYDTVNVTPDDSNYDEDDSDSESEFINSNDSSDIYEAIRRKLDQEEAQRRTADEQIRDRAERKARRDTRADTREQAEAALRDLVAQYKGASFSDEAIEECARLHRVIDNTTDTPTDTPFLEPLQAITSLSRKSWTGFMRLGSPVSEQYLKCIKERLKAQAKEERARRMKR